MALSHALRDHAFVDTYVFLRHSCEDTTTTVRGDRKVAQRRTDDRIPFLII